MALPLLTRPGLLKTTSTGKFLAQQGSVQPPSPTDPPAPGLCTCTGWGSSGTDTGTGTGMSSFNHGGFFRCKLLVLSCRTSDIVPRSSSGLGDGRNHSSEGATPAGHPPPGCGWWDTSPTLDNFPNTREGSGITACVRTAQPGPDTRRTPNISKARRISSQALETMVTS